MRLRRALMIVVLVVLVALPGSAYAFYYPDTPVYTPNFNQKIATPTPNPKIPQHTFGLVSPTYIPPGVSANGVYTTPITPGSKGTTATYNLDWTIGTAGKSGCLVCHGDKDLRRIVAGQAQSMYVDTAVLANSAHAKLLCTDCHTDFAYKVPHANGQSSTETWRTVAKSSCKNCHNQEFLDWAKSAHSTSGGQNATSTATFGRPGSSAPGKPRPLCGDCHDGHTIPRKDDADGQAAIHASAMQMCGNCHTTASANYTDYYHGAAYRRGAPDAPACWQCHGTHQILPSSDKLATTNSANIQNQCAQCHKDPRDGYLQYAPMIHNSSQIYQKNIILSYVDTATAAIESVFRNVVSVFKKSGS